MMQQKARNDKQCNTKILLLFCLYIVSLVSLTLLLIKMVHRNASVVCVLAVCVAGAYCVMLPIYRLPARDTSEKI